MLNERHRHRRIPATPLSVALGLALAVTGPAFAQDDDAAVDAKAKANATELARVQVTGSNIRRSDVETSSPVQVISKQDIENMGARTLLQVLDNLPAARPGQQDSRSLFTGSDGASQANLRGLGAQGTLVLLNGRRAVVGKRWGILFFGTSLGYGDTMVAVSPSCPISAALAQLPHTCAGCVPCAPSVRRLRRCRPRISSSGLTTPGAFTKPLS